MSKRLAFYYSEKGLTKPRLLDEQAVRDFRHAYKILSTNQAKTFQVAMRMVLGTHIDAVPPESVRSLERRLDQIEKVQAETLDQVSQILSHVKDSQARRAAQQQQQG